MLLYAAAVANHLSADELELTFRLHVEWQMAIRPRDVTDDARSFRRHLTGRQVAGVREFERGFNGTGANQLA